ncbi:MAG: hypothetical protein ACQEVA_01635 [Myxococcota bacterium]
MSSYTEGGTDDPLASLYDKIDRAREPALAESPEPVGDDPVETILRWITEEADGTGRRGESSPQIDGSTGASMPTSGSLETTIGREVLSMVAEEPLSPDARAQAVRLLADTLENPSGPALRRVLRLLIKG